MAISGATFLFPMSAHQSLIYNFECFSFFARIIQQIVLNFNKHSFVRSQKKTLTYLSLISGQNTGNGYRCMKADSPPAYHVIQSESYSVRQHPPHDAM